MNIDTFRIASNLDSEAIVKLVNTAYRPGSESLGWTHESDFVSGNRTSTSQIAEILSKPDSVILVGIKDAQIVTCVHVEKDNSNSYIGMLAVNPISQGAGAGKQMLAYAENYAVRVFGSEKLVMVVVSVRTELISFYMRRGYQKTGVVMDYPLSVGAGVPKSADLKIEILEKLSNIVIKQGESAFT